MNNSKMSSRKDVLPKRLVKRIRKGIKTGKYSVRPAGAVYLFQFPVQPKEGIA